MNEFEILLVYTKRAVGTGDRKERTTYVYIHHAPAVKPLWVSSGSRPPEKKELHRFRGSSPSGGKKKRSIGLGVVPLPWEPSKKPERRRTKKKNKKQKPTKKESIHIQKT